MTKLLTYITLPLILLTAFACSSDDTEPVKEPTEIDYATTPGRRTIIAYITGDNNLSDSLSADITEMIAGSQNVQADCRIIVFADLNNKKPFIAHINNGKMTKVKEYDNDFYTTSPDSMLSIYQWIIDHYPSSEYATVIEGHGSGPLINKDTIPTNLVTMNAYGTDGAGEVSATSTSKWINIPSMTTVFSKLKDHEGRKLNFAYIFFDCCCFQSVEIAYQLRHSAEYIIAPISETPGEGANYKTMLPIMCEEKEHVANSIVNTYATQCRLCISAIKTDGLEALCQATRNALETLKQQRPSPLTLERHNVIHYFKTKLVPVLHDMQHLMKTNLSEEEYARWLPYLKNITVTKHFPAINTNYDDLWLTGIGINFYLFRDNMTEENFGGISMIAPSDAYTAENSDINTTMMQLEWCKAVGWQNLGW